MLAPPPEGTFDLDEAHLPIKQPSENGTPEATPLLADESESPESDTIPREKVTTLELFLICVFGLSF